MADEQAPIKDHDPEQEAGTSARAVSKYNRYSMKKMRAVVNALKDTRTKKNPELLYIRSVAYLEHLPQKGAKILLTTLKSAYNNLLNKNEKIADDAIAIEDIVVSEGPSFKRIRPRARGRADRIQKRTSHVAVYLKEIPEENN
jgi:large subunit ribosomal protein L22